jgi:hypothetical protein
VKRLLRTLLAAALLAGCGQPEQRHEAAPAPPASSGRRYPVEIHIPPKLTSIDTGKVDALGRPVRAECVACHTARRPERLPASTAELRTFHQGMTFQHGSLACGSCHVVGAQDTLRKADGTLLPMRDAMQLCAQCHGPQFRDYTHGSHGGMQGHWDLSRGPRIRNHCVDCHDPHTPQFQPSNPVLPPADRLLPPAGPSRPGFTVPRLSQEPHR